MNKLVTLLSSAILIASTATVCMAAETKTSMKDNWICTTNASSSDLTNDKDADEKMKSDAKSASSAFSFASENCRDCTKITCEVEE